MDVITALKNHHEDLRYQLDGGCIEFANLASSGTPYFETMAEAIAHLSRLAILIEELELKERVKTAAPNYTKAEGVE